MINRIINEIKAYLKDNASRLTEEQKTRMYKILNSNNPNFISYGNKHTDIEKYVKEIYNKNELSYDKTSEIFKGLIVSDVHDEKIAAVFLLNRFNKNFNRETLDMIQEFIPENFDTWAITDTTMIRVIGPFLGKKGNEELAEKTINNWSKSENLWVRRASLVILLKIIMMKKEFDEDYVFEFVEKMLKYNEDYIQKGIGWLLKTCSKHKPDSIFNYLICNKKRLPRLILRYASEKLPEGKKARVLKK